MSVTFVDTLGGWLNWTGEKSKFALEKVKDRTGLPWWSTITTVTIGVRLIIFPLRLRAWRNGKMMKMTVEHCNKEFAPKLREYHRINTAPDRQNELFKTDMLKVHGDTLKSLNLSPWKSLSPLPLSVPLFLSVASGLRSIDFGGEGLGGIWKDFGGADPISAVPVFCGNLVYIEYTRRRLNEKKSLKSNIKTSIERTSSTNNTNTSHSTLNSLNTMSTLRQKAPFILGHALNACSFILLSQVPSGVNLFLFTSSIFSLFESKYLNLKDEDRKGTF